MSKRRRFVEVKTNEEAKLLYDAGLIYARTKRGKYAPIQITGRGWGWVKDLEWKAHGYTLGVAIE